MTWKSLIWVNNYDKSSAEILMKEYDDTVIFSFIQLDYLEVPSSRNPLVAVSTITFDHFFCTKNRGVTWTPASM